MTVIQNERINQYIAAGGETIFPYTFRIISQDDIVVEFIDRNNNNFRQVLTLNVDYTLTGINNPNGGNVVLTNPSIGGVEYAIYGINEYRQANYNQSGPFPAQAVNHDLDHIVEMCQQNRRDISRCIKVPINDPLPWSADETELPPLPERAGKFFGFDVNSNIRLSEYVGVGTDQVASVDDDPVVWDGTNADKIKTAVGALKMPQGTTAERPAPVPGMIRYNTDISVIEGYDGANWVNLLTTGTGAPINASYIVRTQDGILTDETALSDLASGILMNQTGTGDLSIAQEGVDYYEPGGTDVAIADGGTGASNAAAARTNLGLAIGSDVQAYNANLQSISGLGTVADRMLYTTAANTWAEAPITAAGRAILDDANAAAQRTTLGLGTIATQNANAVAITGGTITGITDLAIADGGTGASNAAAARTNLGLAIGSDVQAYNANLASISGLGTVAGRMLYTTAANTWAEAPITAAGRAILDDANAAAQRTTLGLGTIATQNANAVAVTGGTITGITDLAIADGGTGASNAAAARTNLGLAIGSDVQAYDAGLDALAAYNTNGILVQTANNTFAGRSIAAGQGISIANGSGVAGNPTVSMNINGLTAESAVVPNTDYIAMWDASANAHRRVLIQDIPGVGTENWNLIGSANANNSASISFNNLDNTYWMYVLVAEALCATDDVGFAFRVSTNNGGTYLTTNIYSASTVFTGSAGAVVSNQGAGNINIGRMSFVGASAGISNANPFFIESKFMGIGRNTRVLSQSLVNYQTTGGSLVANNYTTTRADANNVNAIQFLMTSGNITSGTFKLYGVHV